MARPIDGDALFCKFWNLADPYVKQEKVYPSQVWNQAATMAREAPTLTPPNEPLTIQKLREMDGDKINIHFIGDCAGFYEDETSPYYGDHEQYIQRYNGVLRACDLPLKYYGTQWTATLYRRPPEGEA